MKSDIFSKYFNFSKVLVNIRGGEGGEGGGGRGGLYLEPRDVNWVTYLGNVYSGGRGLIYGGCFNRILWYVV